MAVTSSLGPFLRQERLGDTVYAAQFPQDFLEFDKNLLH